MIPYFDNLLVKAHSREDNLLRHAGLLGVVQLDYQPRKIISSAIPTNGISGDSLKYQDCQSPPSA